MGAGLYAGKIGASADLDVGVKDGKFSLNLDLGASLGVGCSVQVKLDSDVGKAYSNALNDIENGNWAEKVGGVVSMLPPIAFIRGFFS